MLPAGRDQFLICPYIGLNAFTSPPGEYRGLRDSPDDKNDIKNKKLWYRPDATNF